MMNFTSIMAAKDDVKLKSLLENYSDETPDWLLAQGQKVCLERKMKVYKKLIRPDLRTLKDIVGQRFGDLIVEEELPGVRRGGVRPDLVRKVRCKCEKCGRTDIEKALQDLTRPSVKSWGHPRCSQKGKP